MHCRFNASDSLPIGLYRVVSPSLARGSLVLACLPRSVARLARQRGYVHRGSCPGGDTPIGKRVLAVAGDTVAVSVRGLTVNGRYVPGSVPLTHDARGRALLSATPARSIVLGGTVWLFSNHSPRSYDSRYFGAVSVRSVVGGLRVVATR
jgi:conjugative transfer signal peptidase TraF